MLKLLLKQVLPVRLIDWLGFVKLSCQKRLFRPYQVERHYLGLPLKIKIADAMGRSWYDRDWPTLPEIELLKKSSLQSAARVFDLGAHHGVVALLLAKIVGATGQVVAVEASAANVKIAQINKSLNNVQQLVIERAAVAAKLGTAKISRDYNAELLATKKERLAAGSETVATITIDSLSEKYGQPDLLFIDIEGYELEALRGAKKTLAAGPDCFVEVHVEKFKQYGNYQLADILEFFPREKYQLLIARQGEEFVSYQQQSPILQSRFYLIAKARGK